MTVLVGVRCSDGVVIGADSIATSSDGRSAVMQVQSNEKIKIINASVIIACCGSVGLAQRLLVQAEAVVKGPFKNLPKHEAANNLSKRLIMDLQSSAHFVHPGEGISLGSLVAAEIKSEHHLIEYDLNKYQPEFREEKNFYVSMGSGQPLADPFLAFVSRVLWKGVMPDVRMGRFGVYWALNHTIELAPGTVGHPIKIATLVKKDGKWVASMDPDNGEAEVYISELEKRIGAGVPEREAPSDPIPTPPVDG